MSLFASHFRKIINLAPLLQPFSRHLILHVTDRCNLQCRSCFIRPHGRDMSFEEARIIAGILPFIAKVSIGGGEPFLNPELIRICSLFGHLPITLPTNGQMPDRIRDMIKLIKSVVPGELTIAVSIDGFEKTNDSIRGQGTFEKAVESFRILKALRNHEDFRLKVNTVICNDNAGELLEFAAFIRGLKPDFHSFLLLRGSPNDQSLRLPPIDKLEILSPALMKIMSSYDYGNPNQPVMRYLKKQYQKYLWLLNLETLKESRCLVPCSAPWLGRVIYPDGSLSMCELMPPSGNVFAHPMPILEGRLKNDLSLYEARRGPCFCTHNCNMLENTMADPISLFHILCGIRPGPHMAATPKTTPDHEAARTPQHSPGCAAIRTSTPMASILIPAYNRNDDLKILLDQLNRQSLQDFEVVIVDDCSSPAVASSFKQDLYNFSLRIIRLNKRSGVGRARNSAIKHATSETLIFVDSDALIPDKHWFRRYMRLFERANPAFKENRSAPFVFHSEVHGISDTIFGRIDTYSHWFVSAMARPCRVTEHHFPMNNTAVPRFVFDITGYFDEDMKLLEDVDWCLRCLKRNIPLIFIPGAPVQHRDRDSFEAVCKHFISLGKYSSIVRSRNSNSPFGRLFPRNIFSALLMTGPLTTLKTVYLVKRWLMRAPAVLLYAPGIHLANLAYHAGLCRSLLKSNPYRKADRPCDFAR